MRFPAALMVIFHHMGGGVSFIDDKYWSSITRNGPVAVSFFFTLSGFIMASVYDKIDAKGIKVYWISRFARIYPVYGLTLLWFIYAQEWSWPELLLNLTLTQAWVPGHAIFALNAVAWSLSVEAVFYTIFPALMIAARGLGPSRWASIVGCVWLVTQIVIHVLIAWLNPVYPSATHDFLFYFPVFHISAFLVGMLAAILAYGVNPPGRFAGAISFLSFAIAALILLYPGQIGMFIGFTPIATHGLLSPLIALGFIAIVNTDSKLMRSRIAVFLGEASYALFITQFAFAGIANRFWFSFVKMTDEKFWSFISVLIIASFTTFVLIEAPLRDIIRRGYLFIEKSRSTNRLMWKESTLHRGDR
jgi:peptidoglycan/LPS O-acetylase OafA/YrhL